MARLARLTRPRQGKMLAGVCAGVADGLGLSTGLVRLLFVIFAFTGIGEFVYIALWVTMPKQSGY